MKSPQAWKRQRLDDLGYGVPANLHLVPVDFETTGDRWGSLLAAGFHPTARALVSSSGVSMYITQEATGATLRQLAAMAPGSVLAMTFMVPLELVDAAERPGLEAAARGAEASGTPWISFYTPGEIVALADDAGFAATETVTTVEIADRYLAGRSDGLRAASGERILIART